MSEHLTDPAMAAIIESVVQASEAALRTWTVTVTDFLEPPVRFAIEAALSQLADVHFQAWGGYPQAERQRLAICHSSLPLSQDAITLQAYAIAGNFLFDPPQDTDFSQALLSVGINAGQLGDLILLGDRGAQLIAMPDLMPHLSQLQQVRTVPVTVSPLAWSELKVRPPQIKKLTTVEASLRLDALASAGFGLSRSKMVDLIKDNAVRINWQPVTQPSHPLQTGDLVMIRQRGRLEIGPIQITKKERYRVELIRSF